jgi:hypothetical protein
LPEFVSQLQPVFTSAPRFEGFNQLMLALLAPFEFPLTALTNFPGTSSCSHSVSLLTSFVLV